MLLYNDIFSDIVLNNIIIPEGIARIPAAKTLLQTGSFQLFLIHFIIDVLFVFKIIGTYLLYKHKKVEMFVSL